MMQLLPILKILWRSKVGPALVILQLALTIAILSNAIFFINSRIDNVNRPLGFSAESLATFWAKMDSDTQDMALQIQEDIVHIKSIHDVEQVAPIKSLPFSHSGSSSNFHNQHADAGDEGRLNVSAGVIETDHRGLEVLQLELIAGRNFHPQEVIYYTRENTPASAQAIISQSVAERVFPDTSAVGKTLYFSGVIPLTVVGVVEDFLGYYPRMDFAQSNVIISVIEKSDSVRYAIRGNSATIAFLPKAAEEKLRSLDNNRVVGGAASLEQLIDEHYRPDYAMILLLVVVMALLVFINMLGIVGITTFWVNQRRQQIGIRRALGATRAAIVEFFILENALLVVASTLLGAVIAFWASHELVQRYAFDFLPWHYVPLAGTVVLAIALLAASVPARRAAQIPPREAISSR